MYQAMLAQGGSLQTYTSAAFNFGTGDFTVMAMVQTARGGTVVARKGGQGGSGNGGFLLVVNPDGSIKFATDNGFGFHQVVTGPTAVLDGDCHTVAGIRTGATLNVLLDGLPISATASGNATPPLNVDNGLPLTMGCTQQYQEPNNQFIGGLMNVSVWNAALTGDRVVQAAFARITGSEPNLQGYWSLDATSDDLSPNENPAQIVGPVTFAYCLDCVWAEGANKYAFCQIMNMPDGNTPTMTVSLKRKMNVPGGAPALAFAIMADQEVPAFPAGAQVQLIDPGGKVYNQNENNDTVFAQTSGGQLWGLMVVNPLPGTWRVTVTAPATVAFHLTFNTVPSADVVATCTQALDPLFATPAPPGRQYAARALGGFWSMVASVAVAAVVGVIAAGAALIVVGATPLVAVAVGVVAFAVVSYSLVAAALPSIAQSDSIPISTGQTAGMAGFVVAPGKLLLIDADVAEDPATQRTYQQRSEYLYPAVTASTFNKVQSRLFQSQMKREPVKTALQSFDSGYVSASGHGMAYYLLGWYVSGTDGPLEEVIGTSGAAKFTPAEPKGKIIHFFACNCGYMGTSSPGLGRALVAAGAVAFFGYNEPYAISTKFTKAFCAPDIEIDLQMIKGKTCAEAYSASIAKYDRTIKNLREQGETDAAAALERNRNALVSPSTDPVYGRSDARLQIA
ncbi:LamG-like jellyroll fold domain-containing protein [Variovorax paradoxus]|uniref:LamG-like jellyroll fold domain-containing protein n=1 Tax=Variovorax paradoxus TaxID=34073 RepID=UPI003D659571